MINVFQSFCSRGGFFTEADARTCLVDVGSVIVSSIGSLAGARTACEIQYFQRRIPVRLIAELQDTQRPVVCVMSSRRPSLLSDARP
jgi:hypothetical protein